MQCEFTFPIGVEMTGACSKITNKALIEAFTNAGNYQAHLNGHGTRHYEENGLAWFVTNWRFEVYERPLAYEQMTVVTWAQEHNRAVAHRDFEAFDQDGRLVAKGASLWAAYDTAQGKLIRIDESVVGPYGPEPERKSFPGLRFARARVEDFEVTSRAEFKVPRCLVDIYGHVHNPAYLDLVEEAMPEGDSTAYYDTVEVLYKSQVVRDETVVVEYGVGDGGLHVARILAEDGGIHSIVRLG